MIMEQSQTDDKRIFTMAQEKPPKAVLKMGLPVTMGMLFMVAYNLVDTYFIGLLNNNFELAATNFAYPVMMIMIAIAGIVGNGGASYIARCIGAGKTDEANHTLTIGFELVAISGAAITLFGLIFINPLVTILGAKENTFIYTKDYTVVLLWGAVLVMANYAFGQLLRSEGSTFYSMVGMISGTVANIILDPIFIFGLKLEVVGAAIATVLGNGVSVAVYMFYYIRRKTLLMPSPKLAKMELGIIKEIMLVGVPHTLEQFFTTAAMVVNNNLASAYGEMAVAAIGIANKIMSFGSYVYQGMAAGCQPLIGYNYGAKNFGRLKKLIFWGFVEITAIETFIMIGFGIFAPNLIAAFSQSEQVIFIGAKTLRAFMLMLPFVGMVSLARNAFNAMGKAMYAFAITVVRQLVLYIPFLILFNHWWGYDGLIYAQSAEEFICMVLSVIILLKFLKNSDN